jgi:sulfur carrier protein ThiS
VYVNGQLVRREQYERYPIPDGADVRVLHLLGGG